MSGFSSEWLDVREPVDHAARSEEILSAVSHYFMNEESLTITDIGCGTGSTLRALKPFLSNKLNWHLVDNDSSLLDHAKACLDGDRMDFSLTDLSQSIEILFETQPSLITTSAFLDLVSAQWLEKLCTEITARKIPFYAALSYDGRTRCTPGLPLDSDVLDAFNRHQKTDKGFGPAMGPEAAQTAIDLFEASGYLVTGSKSDWVADSRQPKFQQLLLKGWLEAACEIDPDNTARYKHWLSDRLQLVGEENSSILVGHVDFFAVPMDG
ncbi:MAG: class I SAM-dependent methyltransferase [Pseudomonadota bacterium]